MFRMKAERNEENVVLHFSCKTKAAGWSVKRSWLASHPLERNERASQLIPSHLNPVCHVPDLPAEMAKWAALRKQPLGKQAIYKRNTL